jgi:hypothetical protein
LLGVVREEAEMVGVVMVGVGREVVRVEVGTEVKGMVEGGAVEQVGMEEVVMEAKEEAVMVRAVVSTEVVPHCCFQILVSWLHWRPPQC